MTTLAARPFPTRLHVEITSACNQRCRHCAHPTMDRAKKHMAFELFQKVADEAATHGTRLWLHFLGEPLLHPRVFDMVRHAKAAGVPEVGLSTNAVLLTEERRDQVFGSGLDRLEVSIDALDRERYRHMRGCDDFDVVIANVRALLREKLARGARLPTVTLGFLDAGHEPADLEWIRAEWAPLLSGRDFLMSIPAISFGGAISAALPKEPRRPCAWLFGSAVVLSNGKLVACATDFEGERVLGDLNTDTVAEIWSGPEYRALRSRHAEGKVADLALCGSCRDWVHAEGAGYVNFSQERGASRGEASA